MAIIIINKHSPHFVKILNNLFINLEIILYIKNNSNNLMKISLSISTTKISYLNLFGIIFLIIINILTLILNLLTIWI